MRCLVFIVCACSAPQAPATPTVKPQVYCPGWQTAVVGELFPGCGDLPIAGIPCGQPTCERPCGVTIESTKAEPSTIEFEYDKDGHYIRGGDAMTCTYDRGKRVRCASPQASIMIERDARGRITKLLEEHASGEYEDKPVRYDRRGRVVAIGKARYEYDANGQLVRYDDHKLVWKDRAHVAGNWLGRAATFEYDERDRLAKIDLDAEGSELRFTWEAARLLTIKVLGPEGTTTSTYRYCD
jgi:hypothetical protein